MTKTLTKSTDHGIEVGTILVESWGYDQTNIDYYQVVGTTKTGVRLRKIESRLVSATDGEDFTHTVVAPARDAFVPERIGWDDKPERFTDKRGSLVKVKTSRWNGEAEPYVTLTSYSNAYVWNGRPNRETAAGFGH